MGKKKKVSIGGQAVLEGVMMRGQTSMATAVRDADGIIRIESKRIKPANERSIFLRLPIIRGVVALIESLIGGTKVLMRSADVFGESEPSKFEKWLAKKFKVNLMSVASFFAVIIAFALAVFLFMWFPQFIRKLLERIFGTTFQLWAKNFIEGGIKLLIFLTYIFLSSLLKDIRRTFMYHGAEHKTISCFESGMPLTVENARKCSRIHDRCGSTYMVFVLFISIIVFALFESTIGTSVEGIKRLLCKILLLPLVAGVSYEFLKLLAKTKSKLVLPLKFPGMLLQLITTKEPTDDMLEVAITAFKTVYEMDNDRTIPEKTFVVSKKRREVTESVYKTLCDNGITEKSESEWIVSILLNVKRDEVYADSLVSPKQIEKIEKIVSERITGRPLWYCLGDTDFYGYKIKVDERVLIPRPETELLVENAVKIIKEGKSKSADVLDLCSGSGAIAIAVKKETDANVFAVDVSENALSLAKENARLNNCEIEFIASDMFENLKGRKFDYIISNPPYIRSDEIETLQKEVKDFEPVLALDGGKDGLDFYRIISANCKEYLNENGVVLMEVGFGQAQEVLSLFTGYKKSEIIKDYENVDRIVMVVY